MRTDTTVTLLVPPAILGCTDTWQAWHGGLICTDTWIQVPLTITPVEQPGPYTAPLLPLESLYDDCVVTLVNHIGSIETELVFGPATGPYPIAMVRFVELALNPGTYTLKIVVDRLGIDYSSEFAHR
ncbi:hypothetical protein [Nocardia sp. NPDC004860]|uniref:hypothetical protein n=1 Tax=Nocardia sp. NPDC004860 TaxID=3154557 RepID=UPI0033BEA803